MQCSGSEIAVDFSSSLEEIPHCQGPCSVHSKVGPELQLGFAHLYIIVIELSYICTTVYLYTDARFLLSLNLKCEMMLPT